MLASYEIIAAGRNRLVSWLYNSTFALFPTVYYVFLYTANYPLKTMEEIQEFIQKFPELSNAKIHVENPHAKPGGKLFTVFQKAKSNLQSGHQDTCLAFHGTDESNVRKIFENGYDQALRGSNVGQVHGAGEYFAVEPSLALGYCSGNGLILNELLLGEPGKDHTSTGNIIVMKNPEHDLPRLVLKLE